MQRIEHKRKISKEERRLDEEAQDFELLLFSDTTIFPPSPPSSPIPDNKQRCQTKRPKNTRLRHSPITIPGTPSPDYSHRDTNYRQPPLSERLLIDDLDFPTTRKHATLTENDFDFTSKGFPNELYRVGGVQMVREYEGRTQEEDQIGEIEDSKRSLKIYEKAYACYRPEFGESNAESVRGLVQVPNTRLAV